MLLICAGLWGSLSQTAEAQIIGKDKKSKLLFWKRTELLVITPPADTALLADSLSRPSLATASDSAEVEDQKDKKKKRKKNVYFGYRVKKGFARQGKGKNQIVETFYYLRTFKQPSDYVLDKHYFDVKRKKIFKARTLDPAKTRMLILHGPYTKKRGDVVIEQGYFYVGTKHLRWETFRTDSIMTNRQYFNKGFLRDALITYYDAAQTKIKDVVPYQFGEVQGEYLKFYENGQLEWQGTYDKGRKVGMWINYFDFRNRRQFEFQYPETGFDNPFEPQLVKQYDRHGTVVFEEK